MTKLRTGIVKGRNNSDTRKGQDRQYPSSLQLSNVTAATEEGDKAKKKKEEKSQCISPLLSTHKTHYAYAYIPTQSVCIDQLIVYNELVHLT